MSFLNFLTEKGIEAHANLDIAELQFVYIAKIVPIK